MNFEQDLYNGLISRIEKLCARLPVKRDDDFGFSEIVVAEALKPADEKRRRIQAEITDLCVRHKVLESKSYLLGLHDGAMQVAEGLRAARDRIPASPPAPPHGDPHP